MTGEYSLRRRLTLSMLLVFFLGFGVSGTFLYIEVKGTHYELRKRTLQGQVRDLLAGMHIDRTGHLELSEPPDWAKVYAEAGSHFSYTLYDHAGKTVANSASLAVPLPLLGISEQEPFGVVQFTGVGASRRVLLAAKAPGGHVLIVARAQSDPETLAESILFEEDYEQFLAFLLFVFGSLLLIWLISNRSFKPLERTSIEAARVGPDNPSARIGTGGLPSEVLPLVNAVNAALNRLAQAYIAEQRLTADAAHELRTPLAVLSLRLQRARHGVVNWPEIEKDVAQLTRIVGQLMVLARKESAARPSHTRMTGVNLARIVREAAAQVLPLAETSGRSLDVDAPEAVEIQGQADDLRDLVVNLLDNALTHGRGAIGLTLHAGSTANAGQIILEVSDEGPGVPEALKEAVFDRFRKVRATSPGAGLGLAIVRQIARNHGGDVCFPPGVGGTTQVTFPAREAA